jgi:hypothetical protein
LIKGTGKCVPDGSPNVVSQGDPSVRGPALTPQAYADSGPEPSSPLQPPMDPSGPPPDSYAGPAYAGPPVLRLGPFAFSLGPGYGPRPGFGYGYDPPRAMMGPPPWTRHAEAPGYAGHHGHQYDQAFGTHVLRSR